MSRPGEVSTIEVCTHRRNGRLRVAAILDGSAAAVIAEKGYEAGDNWPRSLARSSHQIVFALAFSFPTRKSWANHVDRRHSH